MELSEQKGEVYFGHLLYGSDGVAPHPVVGQVFPPTPLVLSLALLIQAHSSPGDNAELMLIVSSTGDPCHRLVQIWGLKVITIKLTSVLLFVCSY